MPTYVLLSTISHEGAEAIKKMPERIRHVNKEVEKFGAKVVTQYALLGPYDFLTVVEAANNETIARVAVELGSRGSTKILTLAAIPIEQFIKTIALDAK